MLYQHLFLGDSRDSEKLAGLSKLPGAEWATCHMFSNLAAFKVGEGIGQTIIAEGCG